MEGLIKGDIIVIPFPFSDLSNSKRRPAFVIRDFGEDVLVAQITSKNYRDNYAIQITFNDFKENSLNVVSYLRPEKLFTCSRSLILYKAASLKTEKSNQIIKRITELISGTKEI